MSKARGRMLLIEVSVSASFAKLSTKAALLFCLLIPHLNAYGKMQAHPYTIKGTVCPLRDDIDVEEIEPLLVEISEFTNVKFWKDDQGIGYLHSLNWENHQKLEKNKRGEDRLPSYPSNSSSSRRSLEHEDKEEVEVEVKEEEKNEFDRENTSSSLLD